MTSNLDFKNSVLAATTGPITLSGLQTVDTVVLADANRVLVKDQASPIQNGVYQARAGAWNRVADADASSEVQRGMQVFVESGTQALTAWALTSPGVLTIGVSPLTFAQVFAGGGGGSDVAVYQIISNTESWNAAYHVLAEPLLNIVGDGVRDMEVEFSLSQYEIDLPPTDGAFPETAYFILHDAAYNYFGQWYFSMQNADTVNGVQQISKDINFRTVIPPFVGAKALQIDVGLSLGVAKPQLVSAGSGYLGLFSAKWLS